MVVAMLMMVAVVEIEVGRVYIVIPKNDVVVRFRSVDRVIRQKLKYLVYHGSPRTSTLSRFHPRRRCSFLLVLRSFNLFTMEVIQQ